jgi:hypothetical protein
MPRFPPSDAPIQGIVALPTQTRLERVANSGQEGAFE